MYSVLRLLAKVNKWCRKRFLICTCVSYLYTLLFSPAAEILQRPCCPSTKHSPTSANFLVEVLVERRGDLCCSCPGNPTPSFLDPCRQGCGLWEWGGIRRRAWKHVLDSNPTIGSYVSFLFCLHLLLSSFLEIPGRALSIFGLGSTQTETVVRLS